MQNYKPLIVVICGLALAALPLRAQDTSPKAKLNVLEGPTKASLGTVAEIQVPAGYHFLDGNGTRTLLKASGEPVSGKELGWLRPTNAHWSVIFEFDDTGYVKDDDKNKLDADKLLRSIIKGNDAANAERKRMGQPTIEVVGWETPPHYDETTHNLEWAIRGKVQGEPLLNYNTRLLGRKGVMEVVLIIDPDSLAATLPTFKGLLANYSFQSGQKYAEYRPGDKVATYGLAALVAGGAAVGAAKLGLLAWLAVFFKKAWKLVVVAVAAVAAMFKRLFGRLFGGKRDSGTV